MAKILGPSSTKAQPISSLAEYYMVILKQKWVTDYDRALRLASQNQKAVLAAFVGLSWCQPCQILEAEVFKTFKFLEWAYGRVVLLQLDYPASTQQWSAKKKQLYEKYNIAGSFPTILG